MTSANERRKSEYEKDKPQRNDRDPLKAGAITGRHLGYAVTGTWAMP
jgi:hypothetical protein